MAPVGKVPKEEALWREAWVDCLFSGQVDLGKDPSTGQEHLIVRCKEVATEHGAEAEVLDDGRTVGVGIGDTVAFGVVPRPGKAPIAVNIWRGPAKKKRKTAAELEDDDAPQLPASLVGQLTGIVRNQSQKSGDYFIECKKVFGVYQRDAKIRQTEMPERISIGDAIHFELEPPAGENAAPVAKAVRRARSEAAQEAVAQGMRSRGGKGGKVDRSRVGKGVLRRTGAAVMRMVGIVKRPSPHTGRYFIFCQDISDVYGKDCQIPLEEVPSGGLNVGDRIEFDIDEPDGRPTETPFGFNVRVIGNIDSKRKALPNDGGDGEEEGDDEVEEKEEEEAEAEEAQVLDEPILDKEELEDAAAAEELEAKLSELAAEEELAKRPPLKPAAKRRAPVAAARGEAEAPREVGPVASLEDPDTTEGWVAAQSRLFAGLPKLPKGWIRIRSKTRGLVYFYNVDTGESTPHEPRT
mmetsp:Transcript_144494/g.402561  ORF Transcript_144494/g.402561 Transcript_144494/m.402561 type:complete len:465 (-) Transcript_144494:85-1479(-)